MGRIRSQGEIIELVESYCRTPQIQSHILRSCSLNHYVIQQLVDQGILKLDRIENFGKGSRKGIKYYVSVSKLKQKESKHQ